MKDFFSKITANKLPLIPTAIIAVILILLGGIGYQYTRMQTERLREENTSLRQTIKANEKNISSLNEKNKDLLGRLNKELDKTGTFEKQFNEVAKTVSTLNKLSKTDKELLQKYSKVYFLNEHYAPSKLADIEKKYLYSEDVNQQVHTNVLPHLEDMLNDASSDGVDIWIVSAYRSFGTQSSLKSRYSLTYGNGANKFSADQGYSEHQLGTTVDFTTKGLGGKFLGFEDTEAYAWLLKNAYKYGFTLSYPKNNSYYVFEPWHWRFVGVKLAERLHNEEEYFYDVSQRDIDKYLVNIFE